MDRRKFQGQSETLYLISQNIDDDAWKTVHGAVPDKEIVGHSGKTSVW